MVLAFTPCARNLVHSLHGPRSFRVFVQTVVFAPGAASRVARHAVRAAALGVVLGFSASPIARAAEPAPPVQAAVSQQAVTAVSQMGRTLSATDLSFTAKTIRVYLDQSGQPLHIFHTMKVVLRRPNRLAVQVTGDDGSNDLFYDGRSASIYSRDRKEYATIAAPGDIPSALDQVQDKLKVDFPMLDSLLYPSADTFLSRVVAGRQVGSAQVDGVDCRHLVFSQTGGMDLELWVENNSAALPRRMIVTYRLLPGQPRFVAELSGWNTQAHLSDREFAFAPPAGVKKVELGPAVAQK